MGATPPGNLDALTDEVLVVLVLTFLAGGQNDRAWEPFEVLYRRHVREVLNTVYRFLLRHYLIADQDLAWQLTQEAFLRAWGRLPQKNPQAPFLAWIKVIGINQAKQHMRREIRVIHLDDDPPDEPNLLEQSPEEQLVAFLSKTELQSKIERVKMRLPDRQRIVFIMHYEQGFTLQRIAQELGIRPASARQSLWRASVRFRDEWENDKGEPGAPAPTLRPRRGGAPGSSTQS